MEELVGLAGLPPRLVLKLNARVFVFKPTSLFIDTHCTLRTQVTMHSSSSTSTSTRRRKRRRLVRTKVRPTAALHASRMALPPALLALYPFTAVNCVRAGTGQPRPLRSLRFAMIFEAWTPEASSFQSALSISRAVLPSIPVVCVRGWPAG